MTTEAAGLGLADVLADHVMSGGPECLSPSMVWIWRCVCNPGYAHAASARSVALANHRAHVAEEVRTWLRAALTSPEVVEAAAAAVFGREFGTYSEDAHPDHNRWTWLGDGHSEVFKATFREYAEAALTAAAETLGAK